MHGVNIYVAKDFRENKFLSLQARMNSVLTDQSIKARFRSFYPFQQTNYKTSSTECGGNGKRKKDNSKPKDVLLD